MNDASMNRAQHAFETFVQELHKAKEADPSIREDLDHAPGWDEIPQYARAVLSRTLDAALGVHVVADGKRSFAQFGYEAYVSFTGGLNYQGLRCPKWEALPEKIQGAWATAANTIMGLTYDSIREPTELSAFSKKELEELVAGLDALQRGDSHTAHVCFPLRNRLRAMLLFPPAPEPEAPAEEAVGEAPQLETGEAEGSTDLEPPKLPGAYDDYKAAAEASLPLSAPPAAGAEGEAMASDATKPINAAPESPSAEAERTAPATEPSPPGDASEGGVALPSVSGAPAGPGFPELPEIPGPPPMPTDIGAPPAPPPAEPPADAGSES